MNFDQLRINFHLKPHSFNAAYALTAHISGDPNFASLKKDSASSRRQDPESVRGDELDRIRGRAEAPEVF